MADLTYREQVDAMTVRVNRLKTALIELSAKKSFKKKLKSLHLKDKERFMENFKRLQSELHDWSHFTLILSPGYLKTLESEDESSGKYQSAKKNLELQIKLVKKLIRTCDELLGYNTENKLLKSILILLKDNLSAGADTKKTESYEQIVQFMESSKGDAYRMILLTFVYHEHPEVLKVSGEPGQSEIIFGSFSGGALNSLKESLIEKPGMLDKLVSYPIDEIDELAQNMFAFGRAFHKALDDNRQDMKLSEKLERTQVEVFEALITHKDGLEGVTAAAKIIETNLNVGMFQQLCHDVLACSDWGKNTKTYQYVEAKIQERDKLLEENAGSKLQDVRDKFQEHEDPRSVANPLSRPGSPNSNGK